MKNALIFIAGVAVGAAGAIIWLRKSIKKQLSEIEQNKIHENDADLPFEMGEKLGTVDENADKITVHEPIELKNQQKIDYNKIVEQVKNNETMRPGPQVPIMPRDDLPPDIDENLGEKDLETDEEEEESVTPRGEVFFEIEQGDFENDDEYEQKRLVYFRGDRVMCTEAGTVITNPYLFVGNQWEDYVGHYADRTAFVRNTRLMEDYEIYVEDGTYADEYGYDSM